MVLKKKWYYLVKIIFFFKFDNLILILQCTTCESVKLVNITVSDDFFQMTKINYKSYYTENMHLSFTNKYLYVFIQMHNIIKILYII